MNITGIHHIAIICSNYKASKRFYTEVLGFTVKQEVYRANRASYKLDLEVNGNYAIELFSFKNPPKRPSYPEATGLRHMAFAVDDIKKAIAHLNQHQVFTEALRTDEYTGKQFTFFNDPDGLPIEIYER